MRSAVTNRMVGVGALNPRDRRIPARRCDAKKSVTKTVVIVVIVCLGMVNVASCNAQSSNHTNTSSSVDRPSPSPSPSPYLGITKMWRGHDTDIDKNVAVFWVVPGSGMTPDATQKNIWRHVEPDLNGSDVQVFVVKVVVSQGILSRTSGYIYVKAPDGTWGRTNDQELIDKITRTVFE